jgi:hypothetical protein
VLKALIAAAVGAVAATGLTAVGGTATTGPGTIRITDVQTSFHVASIGPGRPGDTEIIRQRLYKPPLTRTIGRGDLLCTYVDRSGRQCIGTYSLPRGKITVSGAISSRLLFEVAVTGGTGLYDNARGTLTVTSTGLRPRREVLIFRLAG